MDKKFFLIACFIIGNATLNAQSMQNVLNIIHQYYPVGLLGNKEYAETTEFQRLKKVCDAANNADTLQMLVNKFAQLVAVYPAEDIQDFTLLHNYLPCYAWRVLTYADDKYFEEFVVNISLLTPQYFIYKMECHSSVRKVLFHYTDKSSLETKAILVDAILRLFPNYTELDAEIATTKVPDFSIGNHFPGEGTVFEYLFTDHIW